MDRPAPYEESELNISRDAFIARGESDSWATLSLSEADAVPDAEDDDFGPAAEANAFAVDVVAGTGSFQELKIGAPDASSNSSRGDGGGLFTIPLLCAGVAIIAACLIIPQADANRRLAYERVKLEADLQAVEKQVQTNDEFLRKVADDPNLAERLAQRQMKIIRKGSEVLDLKDTRGETDEMSPFQLTAVPAPTKLPAYQPRGGALAKLCYNRRSRLHLMGLGLLALAAGLVLGFAPRGLD